MRRAINGRAHAIVIRPRWPSRGEARAAAMAAAVLLQSCMAIGPTVRVDPNPGKSQAAWDEDRASCMSETDAAIQPMSNALDMNVGRTTEQMRSDNGRIQRAYDDRYGHCMVARGNRVAGLAPIPTPAPRPGDAVAQVKEAFDRSPVRDGISASAAAYLEPQVRDFRLACPEEVIAVDVRPAPVSSSVTARLVALTLPHGGGCFGAHGEVDYLIVRRGPGWETLLSGLLSIAATHHRGFADIEQQGAGTCTRTYSWDGRRYVASGARDC